MPHVPSFAFFPAFPALPLALVLGTGACLPDATGTTGSSSGSSTSTPATDAPVIQEIDAPASVGETGAFYVINASITYSDDDDVIVSASVQVPVIGKTLAVTIPPEFQQSSGNGIPFVFQVSDDIPLGGAGPTTFNVTLKNASGAVSTPYPLTIDLE